MASLPPPTTTTTTINTTYSSSTLISTMSSCPFFKRPAQISLRKKYNHVFEVSCKAIDNDDQNSSSSSSKIRETSSLEKVDRRNVVIGLGGLYSAASTLGSTAFAIPIETPQLTECQDSTKGSSTEKINCCPPTNGTVKNFTPPPTSKKMQMRVRPAAHLADKEYIAKYSKAIQLMRELPEDDPRNFTQQANIHCAYCDGGYTQVKVGFPELLLQVHSSWLFFPFHRWYLYFYERILGKLIDDPTFALPFWNWDAADGMQMPLMFTSDKSSSLYNSLRDPDHQPPILASLQTGEALDATLVDQNYKVMYNAIISNGKDPEGFFGKPYKAGDAENPGAGNIETPHNMIHKFCGDPSQPFNEDMGTFYSSGRDPMFYCHHSNVDRLWTIWKSLYENKKKKKQSDDVVDLNDWLNASFLFYDENKQLVRVKVGDCLDNTKLGYVYQDVPIPWLDSRKKPKVDKVARKAKRSTPQPRRVVTISSTDANNFPLKLDKIVKVTVPRPNKSRSAEAKEAKDEKLVIQGIEADSAVFVKFDVYVNDEDEGDIGPENTEFAGSFASLPHSMSMGSMKNGKSKIKIANLTLSISDLLEDLGAEDDDSVVVTLVPKYGSGVEVTIDGIKIVS